MSKESSAHPAATREELLRDARQAHGEITVSLSIMEARLNEAILTERLAHAKQALSVGAHEGVLQVFAYAISEINAVHGYLAAARDAHQALERCLAAADGKKPGVA